MTQSRFERKEGNPSVRDHSSWNTCVDGLGTDFLVRNSSAQQSAFAKAYDHDASSPPVFTLRD